MLSDVKDGGAVYATSWKVIGEEPGSVRRGKGREPWSRAFMSFLWKEMDKAGKWV